MSRKLEIAKKERGWEESLEMCAQRMSMRIEQSVVAEIKNCETLFPKFLTKDHEEQTKQQMIARIMDYLIGTTAALCTHYVSDSPEFEEWFVQCVRDKFTAIRRKNGTDVTQ